MRLFLALIGFCCFIEVENDASTRDKNCNLTKPTKRDEDGHIYGLYVTN